MAAGVDGGGGRRAFCVPNGLPPIPIPAAFCSAAWATRGGVRPTCVTEARADSNNSNTVAPVAAVTHLQHLTADNLRHLTADITRRSTALWGAYAMHQRPAGEPSSNCRISFFY